MYTSVLTDPWSDASYC